jgi:hypothetical protein
MKAFFRETAMTDTETSLIPLTEILPAVPVPAPLVPERSDFLEGDEPAAAKVAEFLSRALPVNPGGPVTTVEALVPWICDALLSNHSIKAYGRDLVDFVRHMR